jgi:hypothetical protein
MCVELGNMPLITFWSKCLGDYAEWIGFFLPLWSGIFAALKPPTKTFDCFDQFTLRLRNYYCSTNEQVY